MKNEFIKTSVKPMPDFDGMYIVCIEKKQSCGTLFRYPKLIECFMNRWVLDDENDNIIGWFPTPEFVD